METARNGWSTTAVTDEQAFDYWRDLICDAFVQLSASPTCQPDRVGPFRGAIEHHAVDDVAVSVVEADGQRVERTRALISRSQEEYLLASIQLSGQGRVHQDGRVAGLESGSMAFYDSTRPYTLDFDLPFRQLVVQVPKSALSGRDFSTGTAVPLASTGPGRLVSDFFVGLAREQAAGAQTAGLLPHALGLLDFALGLAGASGRTEGSAVLRERIHAAIARGATDPDVDAAAVAQTCHISRRTLFRVLGDHDETLTELLRVHRVRRAQSLLRSRPHLSVTAVAALSGFGGEAQLHRAFRRVAGTTPSRWRASG